jgi:hypothetical protein
MAAGTLEAGGIHVLVIAEVVRAANSKINIVAANKIGRLMARLVMRVNCSPGAR